MPIYTKKGDGGTTSLYGGKKVNKDTLQVVAYGELDELSSYIGLLVSLEILDNDKKKLTTVQQNLYKIMGVLAGSPISVLNILQKQTLLLESEIDIKEKDLQPLYAFILPQGTLISCHFHILRAICRRAERYLVAYIKAEDSKGTNNNPHILAYINRCSDLFFVMARWYNKDSIELLA